MNKEFVDDDFAHIWMEDGVVNVVFKITRLDIALAKKSVEVRKGLPLGRSYPMYIDISEIKSATKEAREYLSSAEAIENISASAMLASSILSKMVGTFFLSFNNPGIPIKLFTDRLEAMKWLKKFVETDNSK